MFHDLCPLFFEYIVKSSKVGLNFDWKRMKGLHAKNKLRNMKSFQSGIANRKGQYVICGKAIWRNSKHETLYKKIAELKGQG